jgi:hypothetical protein
MYLQKLAIKQKKLEKLFFVGIFKSLTERAGTVSQC